MYPAGLWYNKSNNKVGFAQPSQETFLTICFAFLPSHGSPQLYLFNSSSLLLSFNSDQIRGGHLQNFGIPLEFQIVGKSAILGKSWNSIGIPIPMIYVFHKISKSNPNTNFWFLIISQSKSQQISEIFGFPIPTYFPTFSVDLFPNSKLSWEKIIDRSEVEDTKNYFLSCFDLRV